MSLRLKLIISVFISFIIGAMAAYLILKYNEYNNKLNFLSLNQSRNLNPHLHLDAIFAHANMSSLLVAPPELKRTYVNTKYPYSGFSYNKDVLKLDSLILSYMLLKQFTTEPTYFSHTDQEHLFSLVMFKPDVDKLYKKIGSLSISDLESLRERLASSVSTAGDSSESIPLSTLDISILRTLLNNITEMSLLFNNIYLTSREVLVRAGTSEREIFRTLLPEYTLRSSNSFIDTFMETFLLCTKYKTVWNPQNDESLICRVHM